MHNFYCLDLKFVIIAEMVNQQLKSVCQMPTLFRIWEKDDELQS